ncbi:FAD synthetase family protein [Sagittula stellata]|uniref:FAD synthase n=1 Tax=Sagittula stellata (strain ATCC 700073 / DSM 11524 / E-37) TaxID=388399 RepID=A3K7D2_SAGS3|nr:FAD synthetase family protein [Sagittula stellata]EBA06891.1 riboflavin biosynthesis protein, truncated [Sagittula stellata E-37]
MDFQAAQTRIVTDEQAALPACVMAIGAFDGVHRGHQALIRGAVAEARAAQTASVVWTFDPPPKVVFGRAAQLCPLEEKLARIARLGPDMIVVARFDRLYAGRSADRFLSDLARLNPRTIHVGADFRFGHRQSGDTALLSHHFKVNIAQPVICAAGETVSSTRIRALRASGRLTEARALQGPFESAAFLTGRMLTQDLRFEETTP